MPETPYDVVSYLLKRRLLRPEHVVEADFVIRDLTRRNKNHKVTATGGPSYLVKQSMDPRNVATLVNEARVCHLLSSAGTLVLRDSVPRCRDYDAEGGILVLEAAPDGRSLAACHAETGRIPLLLARSLGKVLAAVHRAIRALEPAHAADLPYHRPWLFSVLPFPSSAFLTQASGAMMELVRMIQRYSEFCELLEDLPSVWGTDALIHGDLKWDNCVAAPRSAGRRKTRVIITDWEFAGVGDPRWDVGCVLAEYLRFWLNSGPAAPEISPAQFAERARHPPESLQPAIRSFWAAYRKGMRTNSTWSPGWLQPSVKYAAAALIQRTFEDMQSQVRATAGAVLALQLSLNLLRRPDEAAERLLGIAAVEGRA